MGSRAGEGIQRGQVKVNQPTCAAPAQGRGQVFLYSHTSVKGTGNSLWKMQEGKARLFGYASKTLPESYSRYSVTELEMTGLLINMNLWKNLLKHREFDAAVDHVAVAQIMKPEPATTRIMRLLDRLSVYSFNLYYIKGRDMILADYLIRNRSKDMDPSELIPISFCCMDIYRGLLDTEAGSTMYNIGTRSSTKASGEKPPEVHGADKPLDPNLKPEHQSKSKLPSIVGSGSPSKSPKKSLTPKRSPRKSVTISEEPPEEIPMSSLDPDPVQVHAGARPKTHTSTGLPIPPPRPLPPMSPMPYRTPSRVLSCR